jgi:hypothetical protein
MTRETLLKRTIDSLTKLPDQKLKQVSEFTQSLLGESDEYKLTEGISQVAAKSKTFSFLEEEEDLYTKSDLKEAYK